jgi:hypothetical protein
LPRINDAEHLSAGQKIEIRAVLLALGFTPDETSSGSLSFDFGNLLLSACEGFTARAGYAFNFSGVHSTPRTIRMYDFNLPCEIESLDQGKALISYYLRDFRPDIPCLWLEQGRELRHLLPWEQDRLAKQAAYDSLPKCQIERDWFRLAAKKLRGFAEAADEAASIDVAFDGKTILFQTQATTIAMPAAGDAWKETFRFRLKSLTCLPKRLNHPRVSIVVFESRLTIAGCSIPLLTDEDCSSA